MRQLGLQSLFSVTAVISLTACQKAEPMTTPAAAPAAASASAAAVPRKTVTSAATMSAASAESAVQVAGAGASTPLSKLPLPSACGLALDVLTTCSFEATCNADMTLYLPTAARVSLVDLSKKPWFNKAAFARYCESACRANSADVDVDKFAVDVCAASAMRTGK
jgi:hypothetical protein